jgi:hypothetical protein
MRSWSDLPREQQCVLWVASDVGVLREFVHAWEIDGPEHHFPEHIRRLAPAVLELLDLGLIELSWEYPVGDVPPMSREEAADLVANPLAWWNGVEEPVEDFAWVYLTAEGGDVLRTGSPEDFAMFYRSARPGERAPEP